MDPYDRLGQVLDASAIQHQVFFRDDDGGWADDRLRSLSECFAHLEVPLDIAVIPDALSSDSVNLLKSIVQDSRGLFRFHQHGFAHVNHQVEGRACEFGTDRNFENQYSDIAHGQLLLQDHFEDHADPIFTPPWNRCTKDTLRVLEQLGFKILSRITGSDFIQGSLKETPVSVDWLKKKNGVRLSAAKIIERVARQFESGEQLTGIMLHHEHMDADNRSQLRRLVEVLQQSKRVSFLSMLDAAALHTVSDNHNGAMPA